MIPASFDYVKAASADEAVKLLGSAGSESEAKLIAGGHSLLPLMKLRLATPSLLVDVGEIADLSYVRDDGDAIAIGSMTKHVDIEFSDLLSTSAPMLRHAAGQVGDPQVRHRGTIGGSLAHGDPASDLPAVLLAMRASLVALGPGGQRTIAIDDFFTGFLETSLAPDEVLLEIRVPKADGATWSFQKFHRRAMDWAIVGVACQRSNGSAGVALVNMGSTPLRAAAVESAVSGGASAEEAAAVADQGTEPPTDLNASPDYRRHLARVLVRRALEEATA